MKTLEELGFVKKDIKTSILYTRERYGMTEKIGFNRSYKTVTCAKLFAGTHYILAFDSELSNAITLEFNELEKSGWKL